MRLLLGLILLAALGGIARVVLVDAAPASAARAPAIADYAAEAAALPDPSKLLPPLKSLEQTRERPLFQASRRPPPDMSGNGVALDDAASGLLFGRYRVTGVVVAGARAVALFRDAETGKSLTRRENELLDGWQVTGIEPRRVELRRGTELRVVTVGGDRP